MYLSFDSNKIGQNGEKHLKWDTLCGVLSGLKVMKIKNGSMIKI